MPSNIRLIVFTFYIRGQKFQTACGMGIKRIDIHFWQWIDDDQSCHIQRIILLQVNFAFDFINA